MNDQPMPPEADARDAHLLTALRHAPDRDLVPPLPLSASILDQARRAVGTPAIRAACEGGRWRERWSWLWQPAPMAAFGTLAMATLIGVLWGGRELPDATPERGAGRVATAPTVQAPAAVAADVAAPAGAAPVAEPEAAAEKSIERGQAEAPRVRRVPKETLRAAAATPAAPEARAAVTTGQLAEAPANVAPPAPSRAPPPDAVARRDGLAKASADAAPSQAMAAAPARARSEQAALGAAAPALSSQLAQGEVEPAMALPSDLARVRWRVAAGRVVRHDTAQADWWSELVRATHGRWRRVTAADATAVALLIDGAPWGSLGFEPLGLVWRDATGLAWRAPASADELRAWQEALGRW